MPLVASLDNVVNRSIIAAVEYRIRIVFIMWKICIPIRKEGDAEKKVLCFERGFKQT